MASYRIEIKRAAARELEAVGQRKIRVRMVERIRALGEDPRPPGCEKLSGSKDRYRIRLGDYRILYEIGEPEKVVQVVRIGRRSEVHR